MYTEEDMRAIDARIRKNWLVLLPVLAVMLGVYIWAIATRRQALAMVAGSLAVVAACYGFLAYLWPNLRYRTFLRDMRDGLSRELTGTILEISDAPELQDGAMVLPVRLRLAREASGGERAVSVQAQRLAMETGEDRRDEHIVYLNASKRALLPEAGTAVRLRCFGRHIRSAEAL